MSENEGIPEDLFVYPEKIPKRLFCPICMDVANEAVITQCEHLYCKVCISKYQSINGINSECPMCRKTITNIKAAEFARQVISNALVYCDEYPQLRCEWKGKFSMWASHKEKYCKKASQLDKKNAKNYKTVGAKTMSKEDLWSLSISRLKKILRTYEHENNTKISTDWKKFLEKKEYINLIHSLYNDNNDLNNENNIDTLPKTFDELNKLKVRELTSYLKLRNIKYKNIGGLMKKDIINLILKNQKLENDILKNGNGYNPSFDISGIIDTSKSPSNLNNKMDNIFSNEYDHSKSNNWVPSHLSNRVSFSGHPVNNDENNDNDNNNNEQFQSSLINNLNEENEEDNDSIMSEHSNNDNNNNNNNNNVSSQYSHVYSSVSNNNEDEIKNSDIDNDINMINNNINNENNTMNNNSNNNINNNNNNTSSYYFNSSNLNNTKTKVNYNKINDSYSSSQENNTYASNTAYSYNNMGEKTNIRPQNNSYGSNNNNNNNNNNSNINNRNNNCSNENNEGI